MRFWLMIAVFILAGCGGDDDSLKDVAPVPDAINSAGKIEIQFSEEVTGYIVLQTGSGEDLGWLGKVVR